MPPKTKKVVKVVRKLVPKSKNPAAAATSPSTAAATSPSTAAATTSPSTAAATTSPSTAAISPPPTTAVSPPPSTAAVAPPPSTTVVSPPPSAAVVSPPPSASAVSPTPSASAVSPKPSASAVSPTRSASAVSPTPSANPISPPHSTAAEPAASATTFTPPIDAASSSAAPKVSEPDATEAPAATESAEPSEPASGATAPSETSSVKPAAKPTRIVKKIVKKVVVKRVPKSLVAAKAEEKTVVSPPAAEQKPAPAAAAVDAAVGVEAVSEGRRRRKTEIFVGGLDRSAKEEDVRKVFGRVGEIMEVRMMMDNKTGKNKGFAFVRYADATQAKKAVSELAKVEVCGKRCGAAALEGNDTIFLGNIDKKWKKEDVAKLLEESGIEKIDTLTLMSDPNNTELNRGFAFLELETNRDAQLAYKKLQRKDAFGKGRNVKVSWAEPLNDPDEEEMQKVKSVYAEGIPSSWNEDKVREAFKKFGDIERVVLARNIQSAKRKDFAFVNYTTREAALSCIESFEITDNGSKINVHVSLAKPVQKDKQIKGGSKPLNKEKVKDKPKAFEYNTKVDTLLNQGRPPRGGYTTNYGDKTSSTTSELLHVLREQASWKPEQISYVGGSTLQDYTHAYPGSKRPYSLLDDALQPDLRGYPRPRLDSSFPVTTSSSYTARPHELPGSSLSYQQRYGAGYESGAPYQSSTFQRGPGRSSYGSNYYY